nr:hypothetical protein BaRGS_005293 [Batillaria attramentaria]
MDREAQTETSARIGKARAAMVMLKNVWASKVVSIRTKLRIFNSNVKSVLLYGCETWRTTKTMQQKIQTFLNTCLRRIFNIRWPEKIRNEELWERAGQEPVAKQILRRKWGWIGHTLRKPASSTTRQALTWNPQGKRKRGRPRNSWRRDTEAELCLREKRVGNPAIVDAFLMAVQRLIVQTKKFYTGTREVGQDTEPRTNQGRDVDLEVTEEVVPVPVEDWLPLEMRGKYASLFRNHGFDSTLFIAGMTEKELKRIGVASRGHLHYLLAQVALITAFEIEYKVPTNVDDWLEEIGLSMYRENFHRNHIHTPKEMEVLKSFGREDIERELGITKAAQIKAMRMRQVIEDAPIHYLEDSHAGEYAFWEKLKECCLQPDFKAFGLENEVKSKLTGLRNDWLLILAVSNTLWLILITTLASNAALTVVGANPVGLVFLVVFGALFFIQFLTMLQHRLVTLSHFLARAPYRCGRPMFTSWSFSQAGKPGFEDTSDWEAVQQRLAGLAAKNLFGQDSALLGAPAFKVVI